MKIGLISNFTIGTGFKTYSTELFLNINKIKPSEIQYDHFVVSQNMKKNGIRKYLNYASVFSTRYNLLDYDLYHISNQNISFLKNKPKLITCHDLYHIENMGSISNYLMGRVLYSGLSNAIHIITDSFFTKSRLLSHYKKLDFDKISVIYLGKSKKFRVINDLKENDYINNKNRIILHMSNEKSNKNFDTLLKSIYRLKKDYNYKNFKLIKIGCPQDKSLHNYHINLIEDLGLSKDVIFTGYISDDDLVSFYNLADVFVFPSIYEGFGLPPLEAMACGCPVITSNSSSLPEVVGDAGIMVDPFDVVGFSDAMFDVLSDDSLRCDMIKKGFIQSKKFSWEKCARQTLDVYDRVTGL